MILLGRPREAVFRSANPTDGRRAFTEQRLQATAQVRGSALLRVHGVANESGAGFRLHVGGFVAFRGPQARVTFSHGVDGEIDESMEPIASDCPLLPAGTTVPIPDRLATRRSPLPPVAWISIVDLLDQQLAAPICVGTVAREPVSIDPLFEIPAVATLWLTARRPSRLGPTLELAGEVVIRQGLVVRVALAADCNRFGLPAQGTETFDIVALQRGTSLPVPSRRVSTVVRGNPFVSVTLRGWDGRSTGAEMPVGWLMPFR